MAKEKTKKPIPLDGDALSTGVLIAKASVAQLNIEAGRLIKIAAQRCAEFGVMINQDERCKKALARSEMMLGLCKVRLDTEAGAAA